MGIFQTIASKYKEVKRQSLDERKAECPSCHKPLQNTPTKKTKCPHCGEYMFVRARPKDNARVVVTKKDADKIDKEWLKQSAASALRSYIVTLFSKESEFEKTFDSEKERLIKQFGSTPSEQDVLWGLANKLLGEKMKAGDWGSLQGLYFNIALYLHQICKPSFLMQKTSQEMLLRYYQKINYCKKVEILVTTESCDVCKKQEKKVFTLDEALKKMPIPVKNCTNKINQEAPDGWCVCSYLPVVE